MSILPTTNQYQSDTEKDTKVPTDSYLVNQQQPLTVKALVKRKTVWFFLIFVIGVVFLSGWYFKTQVLESPLALEVPDYIKDQLAGDQQDNEELLADLKTKDTDQDGLNDYQEIYQFHTSIFLADSDSDGFTDSEEVNSGNDPLCPTGEKCNLLRLITPNTKLSDIIEEVTLDPNMTLEQATLNQFRKFLLDNGLTSEEVADLTDEDLITIFTAWEEANQIEGEENLVEALPEEVREFLLSQPEADTQAINNLTEQELIDIRDRLSSQ